MSDNRSMEKFSNHRILVVDDEASIRKTLESVLRDEGYEVLLAADGEEALKLVETSLVSAVLLDIWMPGMDGLEVLQRIRSSVSSLPVIMISGHATIATAISATRLGACDFIEKPLDLHLVLAAIKRALHRDEAESGAVRVGPSDAEKLELFEASDAVRVSPVLPAEQRFKGKKVKQKTIATGVIMYGQGLHSGKKSGLVLEPLPSNSGIHFVGIGESTPVPALVDYVGSTGFATTVRLGSTQAGTIEHLMSALHVYGVTNLLIKCNGEVPVMDGSSREFCLALDRAGVVEQEGDWFAVAVPKTVRIGDDREYIEISPADKFSIEYSLQYPDPVGEQRMYFELGDIEQYLRNIAPARTFGFVRDIGALQRQGLALGGRFDNFVLMGEQGPINGELRFPDEPVRHKILDAIGDLYLLGRPLQGSIRARMTGHSDNIALLTKLKELMAEEAV